MLQLKHQVEFIRWKSSIQSSLKKKKNISLNNFCNTINKTFDDNELFIIINEKSD
jgi:hypothetical protein